MNFPAELKYTKDHEWIRIEGEEAVIGITEFAQSELGDIVFVDIDTIDDEIKKDEIFGSVEAVKTVSDLFMPVTAKVLSMNSQLDASPELVNNDPYGEGWMIRVKLNNPADLDSLLSAEEYKDLISA
jgi:glycine cleavage system H protein